MPEETPTPTPAESTTQDQPPRPIIRSPFLEECPPEHLSQRLLDHIKTLDDPGVDPRDKKYLFRDLGLELDASESEIQTAVEQRVTTYLQKLEQLEDHVTQQQEKVRQFYAENNLRPSQQPDQFPIYLLDRVINRAFPSNRLLSQERGGQFNPEFNAVILSVDSPDWVLAHELAHACSYSATERQAGWMSLSEDLIPDPKNSNKWLDEGSVMMVEFALTNHTPEQLAKENELYSSFYQLTKTLQDELSCSDQLFLQAHLQTGPEREEVERRVRNRYNCSINDLQEIHFGFNPEIIDIMIRLLRGESANWEINAYPGTGMEEKFLYIMALFPKFKVKINRLETPTYYDA